MADPTAAIPADRQDERLIAQQAGVLGLLGVFWSRLKGGELGSLPVVFGLAIISVVFYVREPIFLSSRNLVSITQFAAPIGVIALGIVLVLLLGEIDLSVGSVSGASAADGGPGRQPRSLPSVRRARGVAGRGADRAGLRLPDTKIGVPSFVFSLAGLLGFQGVLLYVLGTDGTINLPAGTWLAFRAVRVPQRPSLLCTRPAGRGALPRQPAMESGEPQEGRPQHAVADIDAVKAGLLAVGLGWLTFYLNIDRGWSYLWLLFAALVVVMDFALRRTKWGRHLFAVGGNEEAARRSGIKVDRIYVSVFVLCSTWPASAASWRLLN